MPFLGQIDHGQAPGPERHAAIRPDAVVVRPAVAERLGHGIDQRPRLADAIVRLLADPPIRSDLGARARTNVPARFSAERAGAEVANLYRELLT